MLNIRQSPASAGTDDPGSISKTSQVDHIRKPLKWRRVLRAFLDGKSYNRFEATRELRDWCLHSTVSGLEARGVKIQRRDEVVAGYQGIPTRVCRYWLAPESLDRARELLSGTHRATEGQSRANAS